jgi:hypothetical protein
VPRCNHPFSALAFTSLAVVCTRCDEQVREIECMHPWSAVDITDARRPTCTLCKEPIVRKQMIPMPPRPLTDVVRNFLALVRSGDAGMQSNPRAEVQALLSMQECLHAIDDIQATPTPIGNETPRTRGR